MTQHEFNIELKARVSGHFRFEKYKTDENGVEIEGSRVVAAEFENMVVNSGLNQMAANANYLTACQVGAGNTPASAGQTTLVSRVAGTQTRSGASTTVSSSAPYYLSQKYTFTFAEGVAAGNLAEVGIGTNSTTSWVMFSRALIKDSGGTPTTITVLSDESLDVIYEFRFYAPVGDVTGTITATGSIGGTYDYVLRLANATTSNTSNGWSFQPMSQAGASNNGYSSYPGDIGPVTAIPAGTRYEMTSPTFSTYTAGNFYIDATVRASASQANIPTGIRSMLVKLGFCTYQIQFDPPIPKTDTDVVALTLRQSWANKE